MFGIKIPYLDTLEKYRQKSVTYEIFTLEFFKLQKFMQKKIK